jgi:fumarylacetoacetate (FAA) hydrolase
MIDFGEPRTPFLRDGERIRLESTDATGQSVFGAIDQRYVIVTTGYRLDGDPLECPL